MRVSFAVAGTVGKFDVFTLLTNLAVAMALLGRGLPLFGST